MAKKTKSWTKAGNKFELLKIFSQLIVQDFGANQNNDQTSALSEAQRRQENVADPYRGFG